MKRIIGLALVLVVAFVSPLRSQTNPDQMGRSVVHLIVPANNAWYATTWLIGNVRREGPSGNFNVFSGVGRKVGSGFVEVMVQKQWAKKNAWFADLRTSFQYGDKISNFNEISPALAGRGVYHLSTFDYSVTKHGTLGVETENYFSAPKSSLAAGPRVSWLLAKTKHQTVATAFVYYFRRDATSLARLYLVVHQRF